MSYETVLGICQLVAMAIFGTVMAGILVHVLRPEEQSPLRGGGAPGAEQRRHDGEAAWPLRKRSTR